MSEVPLPPPSADAPLDDWLAYQERLHPRTIELGLDRVGAVAHALGLDRAPPTLTIAGTNGKGSSAHLAAAALQRLGYRVGLYTSPHLLHYAERVRVDGQPVSDAALCAAFAQIERARGARPLTYFEFGTLAALWCFREAPVDVQVLEVGLGGRLDAVNLVDADAALVTSIGLDHLDWLGPDRESIAFEKAQVFRRDRLAVCAEPDPPAAIAGQAAALGARLWQWGREFGVYDEGAAWTWYGPSQRYEGLPRPALPGPAYLRNAGGVIAALQGLRPRIEVPQAALEAALREWSVPGRFQVRGRTVFDVAHNAEAAAVLADLLARRCGDAPVVLVLGMMADKPVDAFCRALSGRAGAAYCIGLPGPRACDAATLAGQASAAGMEAWACASYAEAWNAAHARAGVEGWVVVTGSFLTVAAGMAHG